MGHKSIGANINDACHKKINSGWHACGLVKDNYHGQSCAGNFGGTISGNTPSKTGGTWGGYQSFITRAQVAANKWAGKGTCDHDAVWICCSPQCDTKTGKPAGANSGLKSEVTKLSASYNVLKTALAVNSQKDVSGHAMAMCMGAPQTAAIITQSSSSLGTRASAMPSTRLAIRALMAGGEPAELSRTITRASLAPRISVAR